MSTSIDMTRGRPLKLMARFAVPLILSSLLQQAYSLADSAIVGWLIGVEAFAAVGASSFLSWLPTSMLMGLSQGFGVLLAQRFGAGDREGLRRATLLSAAMASAAALAMTALGISFLTPLLVAVQTPAEMMAYSADYLRVVFSGLLATGLYNVAACALRAQGDSRSPLIALVISTVLNIALDWALVALADMGVEGVALATVIAQCASLAYCGAQMRRTPAFPPAAGAPMTSGIAARLLKLGLPPMVRDGVVAVGGLFVQRAVNGFGTAFVAGMTAAQRYFSMLELVGAGLDGSLATFVAQNAGAGKRDRIAEGTRSAVRFGVVASIVTAVLAAALAQPLVSLLVGGAEAEVVGYGVNALRFTALFLPALYLLYIYRAVLQGMGDSITPTISGFAELAMRMASVMLLPPLIGRGAAYIANGMGWLLAAAVLMGVYYARRRRSRTADDRRDIGGNG